MPAATQHRFVDMRIADVLKVPAPPGCYIVLLEERDGQRQLLIWIAGAEATSMALRLAGMGLPARPLGWDLTAALVEALGGRLHIQSPTRAGTSLTSVSPTRTSR